MATDLKNTNEDAEMAECEGEKVVTMMDVLKEQEDFEEDANAVLGGSDDKNCTYAQGYIKRQALYACLTCSSEAKTDPEKRAGVCLACSLMCHENHELIELYTKRNFRCDCGNPKFNLHPCTFTPNKTDLNENNSYNQNFSGVYCICKRPYPDPEATVEDEMIQCIICEDWLHSSHLEATVPANDQYSEMICKQCMEKNEFLHDYSELVVNTETNIEIVQVNGNDSHNEICNGNDNKNETNNSLLNENNILNVNVDVEMPEKAEKEEDINPPKKKDETEDEIIADTHNKNEESEKKDEINVTSAENDLSTTEHNSSQESHEKVVQNSLEIVTETNLEKLTAETEEEGLNNTNPELNSNKSTSDNETEKAKISEATTKDNETVTTSPKEDKSDSEATAQINQSTAKSENLEIANSNENKPTLDLSEQEPKATAEDLGSSKEDIKVSDEEKQKNKEKEAEKNEEDRLLADPEEESKSGSKDNKESTNENNTESNSSEASNNVNVTSELHTEDATSELTKSEHEFSSENKDPQTSENKDEENRNIQEENTCNTLVDSEMKTDENVCSESEPKTIEKTSENSSSEVNEEPACEEKHSEKRKLSIEKSAEDLESKKPKLEIQSKSCLRPQGVRKVYKGATFWPSNFRQKLCSCPECISMYKDLSVLFLTDPEDTVSAYENLGKEIINGKPLTQYEKGLEALSSLDRIQQINALTEYNKMRDKLLDFLKSFKDRKEIVKEEDIKAFFAGMKPKREPDGVYFCR